MGDAQALANEIAGLFAARAEALARGDRSYFETLLDAEFTYTNASGRFLDRSAYLDLYLDPVRTRWQSQTWDDLEVHAVGGVVVATCRLHDLAVIDGHALDARFRTTQVFVRHGSGWRYVAGQTTAVE